MKLPRAELKKARIEIIPMIDTIFFLLVFFMMSSLQRVTMSAPRVNLPLSALNGAKPLKKVVLSVDQTGSYFIDKEPVELEEILPELKKRLESDEELSVILNADSKQQAGQLLALYDVAKKANPAKIYIATAPEANATGSEGPVPEASSTAAAPAAPATPAAPAAPAAPAVPAGGQ